MDKVALGSEIRPILGGRSMNRRYILGFIRAKFTRSVLLLGALALGACASPAEMQNMVVDQSAVVAAAPNTPFKEAIVIARVDGGEKTNPLWTSEVDGPAFRGALEMSLDRSGLLAKPSIAAKYDLQAILASVDQPLFGLDLTVTSRVDYRLVERETLDVCFDKSVYSSYTATFGDSPIAIQRLRLANEGSIRENIKSFIQQLISVNSAQK